MDDQLVRRGMAVGRARVNLLTAALGAVVATAAYVARPEALRWHGYEIAAFMVLLVALELADMSFYDSEETWGLSSSEAVVLPMLLTLSFHEVVVVVTAAILVARLRSFKRDVGKELFNVAQFSCAAAAGALTAGWISAPAAQFGPLQALAATAGVLVFAGLTHVFVAAAFHLSGRGRFSEALLDVAPAAIVNLGGNIVLGLIFAAAFVSARWTVVLFPVALGALHFGYRAVVRQKSERRRMERLHEASRALVGVPDLASAVESFLVSTAATTSALGATAVLQMEDGYRYAAVYAGETVVPLEAIASTELEELLRGLDPAAETILTESELKHIDALGLSVRNVRAVPMVEDHRVTGLLAVIDRVGADEFRRDDVRFLQALANELALGMKSYRLFDQVTEEREKFGLLMESVTDYAIYMLDPAGRVVSWNQGAERIFGFSSDEIVGRHFSIFYLSDDGSSWRTELDRAARDERHEVEGWRIRRDGTRFLVDEVIAPVLDETMQLRGFAKVTRDITERMRAEKEKEDLTAQLHQSQRLESVGQLAGGIAHDFNNLLSVILNCAHFLELEVDASTQIGRDVEQIKDAAQRAAGLTRQLLVFSRRDMIEPRSLDLNEVVTGLQKLLSRTIGEDIAVKVALGSDIGWIEADPSQVEQVIMNLAVNARDAMPGGGTFTIETGRLDLTEDEAERHLDLAAGPYVVLRVTDTGLGMAPGVLQKAFDPFFTTKPKGRGTGLGLATVYGIVTGAGGSVEVHSEPGLGTSFEIMLPELSDVEALAAERRDEQLSVGTGETILVVEDEDALRKITARILTQNGYQVIEACNGRDAVFKLGGGVRIDLLLTDVVMPEMSGVELAERVREAMPYVKVLMMSGYSSGTFANGALDARVLQKPFEPEELLSVVKQVLSPEALSA